MINTAGIEALKLILEYKIFWFMLGFVFAWIELLFIMILKELGSKRSVTK